MRDDNIIQQALRILEAREQAWAGPQSPRAARELLRLALSGTPNDLCVTIYLDERNRVLAVEDLYRGRLVQTTAFRGGPIPELRHGAVSVIFAHNRKPG